MKHRSKTLNKVLKLCSEWKVIDFSEIDISWPPAKLLRSGRWKVADVEYLKNAFFIVWAILIFYHSCDLPKKYVRFQWPTLKKLRVIGCSTYKDGFSRDRYWKWFFMMHKDGTIYRIWYSVLSYSNAMPSLIRILHPSLRLFSTINYNYRKWSL
jgi:hypothetical protein